MREKVVFIVIPFFIFFSCKPSAGNLVTENAFEAHYDLRYGADSLQQSFDYYLPVNRIAEKTPVVIMLHGGAWVQGDKSDWNGLGFDTFFTSYGYAVVNMNYRLDRNYPFPAPIDDIGMVIERIEKEAPNWRVNAQRICLLGKSSGAHLALLYGYSRKDKRVKTVVECSGPADFTDSSIVQGPLGLNVAFWLGDYSSHQQLWHNASPVFYVKDAVPTIILQGLNDNLVPNVQADKLRDSLEKYGIANMFIGWQNAGHSWNMLLWPPYKLPVIGWLKEYL